MIIDLFQDPVRSLLDIYPKEDSFYHRDTYSTILFAALFKIASNWKEPRCTSQMNVKENVYLLLKRIKLPNNREIELQLAISLHQMKLLILGMGYI